MSRLVATAVEGRYPTSVSRVMTSSTESNNVFWPTGSVLTRRILPRPPRVVPAMWSTWCVRGAASCGTQERDGA